MPNATTTSAKYGAWKPSENRCRHAHLEQQLPLRLPQRRSCPRACRPDGLDTLWTVAHLKRWLASSAVCSLVEAKGPKKKAFGFPEKVDGEEEGYVDEV